MLNIGRINTLNVVGTDGYGYRLDGGAYGELVLSSKNLDVTYSVGDSIDVFIYLDSNDQLAATVRKPLVQVGEYACLRVVDVNPIGAFLDWGLPKHVLVPFDEQKAPMRVGESYVVYLYIDKKTQRIVATPKVERFLKSLNDTFKSAEPVSLLVYAKTDLGYKCIVENTHTGMLYYDDVFKALKIGQRVNGYIKQIREDEKIDLCLTLPGFVGIESVAETIMTVLNQSKGFIPLTDKSPPADIYNCFKVSKQTFKRAIGVLYRERRIVIEKTGIRSNDRW